MDEDGSLRRWAVEIWESRLCSLERFCGWRKEDKNKDKDEIQGFFAALRMTAFIPNEEMALVASVPMAARPSLSG
jgi:hypothetical protein